MTNPVPSVIRIATLADVAPLAEQTFRDTFAADNSAEDMDAYVRTSLSLDQLRAEIEDATNTFLLAFASDAQRPVGYAKFRTSTADPNVSGPRPVELERLYVDQRALGHGVGAAIMQACLDRARAAGFETMWLGVWEHNERAKAFYAKWAFRTVGSHVFQLGADAQTDLIMQRPL